MSNLQLLLTILCPSARLEYLYILLSGFRRLGFLVPNNTFKMTSYISIIQQIFSSSIVAPAINATTDQGTLSNRTTEVLPSITEMPQDISSFIALLFSFTALRDWLKLIVIGGFFETCRRLVVSTYSKVVDSFFISASFDQGDASYSAYPFCPVSLPTMYSNLPDWILVWLSKQPSWSESQVQVHPDRCG